MWRRSAALVLAYVLGAVAVVAWSAGHVVAGSVTRDNAALVIVLPFAWIFGYWGVVGPLVMVRRVWRLQARLEEYCQRRSLGLPADAPVQELEDTLAQVAADESGLPRSWARGVVRRVLERADPDQVRAAVERARMRSQ